MANETVLSSLINPEVMGDYVENKLHDRIRFGEICEIDNTLEGRAGDTLSLPKYGYIGDATTVAELGAIPIAELTASKQDVKVTKAGRGVKISDEARLSAYGNPIEEAARQLADSIANKQDNDVLGCLDNATWVSPCVTITANAINDALTLFGEDVDGEKYLYVSPASYSALRLSTDWIPATQLAADIARTGVVGMIYGCYVRPTNKITANDTGYIVKPGAVKIINKRGVEIEPDRDVEHKATLITADKHYAAWLYNASKVVKLGTATLTELTLTQTTAITSSKAKVAVTGFPTNLSAGWKAYYATNLSAAVSVSVGDAYSTVSSTFGTAYEGEAEYAATNAKYFQVIYVDADNKIRASGSVQLATSIS